MWEFNLLVETYKVNLHGQLVGLWSLHDIMYIDPTGIKYVITLNLALQT